MKKIYLAFAAVAVLASSCMKDNSVMNIERKMVRATIEAEPNNLETRTTATWNEGESRYDITWNEGDSISVFCDGENYPFIAESDGKTTKFNGYIPEEAPAPQWAVLPYSKTNTISDNKVSVRISPDQDGTFSSIVLAGWPNSVTRGDARQYSFAMQFEAVSGILKFSFDPAKIAGGKTVVQVNVSASDRPLAGDAIITYPEVSGVPVMKANPNTMGSNVYNSITVTKPQGFAKGDYYIATFPITTEEIAKLNIVFRMTTSDGEVKYVHATLPGSGKQHILTANIVKDLTTVRVGGFEPKPFTSGVFSVSATKKVTFSRGNLQYQASTGTWRFANNQWDAMGDRGNLTPPASDKDEGLRATQSEWIDLFPWGHSGWTYQNSGNKPTFYPYTTITGPSSMNYCLNNTTNGQSLKGDPFSQGDWGQYCDILNGETVDEKGTWRLLTMDEWQYMLGLGAADPGETGHKLGRANVMNVLTKDDGTGGRRMYFMRCGVRLGVFDKDGNEVIRYGLMIFPDHFEWPADVAKPVLGAWPHLAISWKGCNNENAPKYDIPVISKLEALGCVFLPGTAFRPAYSGNPDDPFSFTNMGPAGKKDTNFDYFFNNYGRYWSSNNAGSTSQFVFYPAQISFETAFVRVGAEAVRLVKDVPQE